MFTTALRRFFPFAVAITLLCGIVYVVGQQQYRMAANDPQEQLVSDAAARITAGEKPENIVTATTEICRPHGTFVVVYDNNGKVVAGDLTLNGEQASVPLGSITFALEHGTNRISWQPKTGVREAVVLQNLVAKDTTPPYVVAAGRSLSEAERRIGSLGAGVAFGWVVTMLATFFSIATTERKNA